MRTTVSAYELAIGDVLHELHPRLQTYFDAIPEGRHGFGHGVFSVVGTPRRWLWPVLWVLGRQGILFPAWGHDVPFTVVNRPVVDQAGNVAVAAVRTFRFTTGERHMVDAITAESGALVDHLGRRRRYAALLAANVVDGSLRLKSTRMAIRVGRRHLMVPRAIAPRVTLTESFDGEAGLQRVSVTVDAPVIGTLYTYAGSFGYEIRPDETAPDQTPPDQTPRETA